MTTLDDLIKETALTDLTHTRSCPSLTPLHEEDCTCGLLWRKRLRTEMEMHNAWRKRAEEAETALEAYAAREREWLKKLEGVRDKWLKTISECPPKHRSKWMHVFEAVKTCADELSALLKEKP